MESRMNHSVTVVATGFIVLLLLSLPLFWARRSCEITLGTMMPEEYKRIQISPSGLFPPEFENDPNVVEHSFIEARMGDIVLVFSTFRIINYFESKMPEEYNPNIYYYHRDNNIENYIYFDEKIGQIICHHTSQKRTPNGTVLIEVNLYAGPEGISETANKTLGRFTQPIAEKRAWYYSPFFLYDKKLHRFFKIDFEEGTVIKGPELTKDNHYKPIQIGVLGKNYLFLNLREPRIKASEEVAKKRGYTGSDSHLLIPIIERDPLVDQHQSMLVLDKSGRIDLLDRKTLEYAGTGGYLPAPQSIFPSKRAVTPKDLLAYEVWPLVLSTDHKYRGMYAASINREGTAMTLAVFDEEGKLIGEQHTNAPIYYPSRYSRTVTVPSSEAVFFGVPWAPVLTIIKFLYENLHPPVLSVASYALGDSIEATAGHVGLFILPNSFIAMKGRDVSGNMAGRFAFGLLLISPSIILAIVLAWLVEKDAILVGLSENARLFWMIGTIAFGLSGYITYRLTRPKETLVTCVNCGRLRRPDMDRCHRCGSKWHVPEITPPTWRVTDSV